MFGLTQNQFFGDHILAPRGHCCLKLLDVIHNRQGLLMPTPHIVVYLHLDAPYLTLPSGWAGCYTCPALRPYQFGPMRNPDVTRRSQ